MTTMASGFSVARMPLAAAAQSAGSPLGWYLIRPETVLCLADHAHVGLFGVGVLEAIGEPVRHGVAEHQHVALRHGVVALLRRRRLGKILDPLRLLLLLLERCEQVAAEPAAAAKSAAARRAAVAVRRN